jgi:hypothetical protein
VSIPIADPFVNEARNVVSQRDVDSFITSTSGPFSPPGVTHAISAKQPWSLPDARVGPDPVCRVGARSEECARVASGGEFGSDVTSGRADHAVGMAIAVAPQSPILMFEWTTSTGPRRFWVRSVRGADHAPTSSDGPAHCDGAIADGDGRAHNDD